MGTVCQKYPFRSFLSLRPLIDFWSGREGRDFDRRHALLAEIQAALSDSPELDGPIEDLSVLHGNWKLVETLMTPVFPDAFWETIPLAAFVPFTLKPVYWSPEFQRLFLDDGGILRGESTEDRDREALQSAVRAYYLILQQCYGVRETPEQPLTRSVTDPSTGLDRYYRLKPSFRFVDVKNVNGPESLSSEDLETILNHINEPEVLRRILPPEAYEFHGFTVLQAVDVTEPDVLLALERDLIDKDSIVSQAGFLRIQERLRTLFQRPDMTASLAAVMDDEALLLNKGCEIRHNCIFADSRHVPLRRFVGSIFERAADSDGIFVIRDMERESPENEVNREVLDYGFRSILMAPLHYRDEFIGALELASPHAGDFGPQDIPVAEQITPLFAMALKRAVDEFESNVNRVIKERCTAVHPSVEWRFRKAVIDRLKRVDDAPLMDMEPIVFHNVLPFYGAVDIRGSSEARSLAIQADLAEHFSLAAGALEAAVNAKPLPLFLELSRRIAAHLEGLRSGLASGEETSLLGFLRGEVEPVFSVVRELCPAAARAVSAYEASLEAGAGTVYKRRKDFEESVSAFNHEISAFLDQEEAKAQSVFPHYFDKHQTDGVDYTIYLGESMVEDGRYHDLYARNLRLWQIMTACGIARRTEMLKSRLTVPLDATHLILAQHAPLSIRFRFDEKRFDVDGAYDVGHEIIRSRIDKAVVKGTRERLTQPGRIAIVYSRPEEAEEMLRHMEYLQAEGYLLDDTERLELDHLPGVQGLRALRVGVNLNIQTLTASDIPTSDSRPEATDHAAQTG